MHHHRSVTNDDKKKFRLAVIKALFRRVRKTAKSDNAVSFRTAHSMGADFAHVKSLSGIISKFHTVSMPVIVHS
jgi:hypothetical protein